MLPEEIRTRVKYLSDNFDKKECRQELMQIIKEYLKRVK